MKQININMLLQINRVLKGMINLIYKATITLDKVSIGIK
jgi:hypothetical protein